MNENIKIENSLEIEFGKYRAIFRAEDESKNHILATYVYSKPKSNYATVDDFVKECTDSFKLLLSTKGVYC